MCFYNAIQKMNSDRMVIIEHSKQVVVFFLKKINKISVLNLINCFCPVSSEVISYLYSVSQELRVY